MNSMHFLLLFVLPTTYLWARARANALAVLLEATLRQLCAFIIDDGKIPHPAMASR